MEIPENSVSEYSIAPTLSNDRVKLMGLPSAEADLYHRRSPVNFAEAFRSPVLILHGEADSGVPCPGAMEMAEELKRFGKECEIQTYPGEGHVFMGPAAIQDSFQRIERFLDDNLAEEQS